MKNMKKWCHDVIATPERIAIPIMTHPGIELCGKTVKQAVTNGQTHAEAICKLNEVYPAAASTVIMDLTVEAECFGSEIVFRRQISPRSCFHRCPSGTFHPVRTYARIPESQQIGSREYHRQTCIRWMYRPFLFGRTIVRYVGNDDGPLYGARQYTASARKMHRVHYQLSACHERDWSKRSHHCRTGSRISLQ